MNKTPLTAEREHLANLLEAVQRCTHFMHASGSKVAWPLNGVTLRQRCKEVDLFESLVASKDAGYALMAQHSKGTPGSATSTGQGRGVTVSRERNRPRHRTSQ